MNDYSTHPEDIRAEIRKRHGSLAQFERARGLPRQSARDVLRGKAVARTALAIANELGATIHELFPGRFPSLKWDDSTVDEATHRLNAGAR